MRSRVKAGGFEMTPHVGNSRGSVGRQRDGTLRDEPIDVVHAEANALEVKRADRTIQRFRFRRERREMIVRRKRADQGDEVGCAALGRETIFAGHAVRTRELNHRAGTRFNSRAT
jgi:hypothetical protein